MLITPLQLYERRLKVVDSHSLWPRDQYKQILHALTSGGMSSDESESDSETEGRDQTKRTFRIVEKPWRSRALTRFIRQIDSAGPQGTWRGPIQGNPFRDRNLQNAEGPRGNNSIPLRGLPSNFYDSEWLQAQSDALRLSIEYHASPAMELPPQGPLGEPLVNPLATRGEVV